MSQRRSNRRPRASRSLVAQQEEEEGKQEEDKQEEEEQVGPVGPKRARKIEHVKPYYSFLDDPKNKVSDRSQVESVLADVIRFILFKNAKEQIVSKAEMMKMTKDRLPPATKAENFIREVRNRLRDTFGFDLRELPKLAAAPEQRARKDPKERKKSSQKEPTATASSGRYVLVNAAEHHGERLIPEVGAESSLQEERHAKQGLILVVCAILHSKIEPVLESVFWDHMEQLGLSKHQTRHVHFGNVASMMQTLEKEKWVERKKLKPGAEEEEAAEPQYVLSAGPRAYVHTNPMEVYQWANTTLLDQDVNDTQLARVENQMNKKLGLPVRNDVSAVDGGEQSDEERADDT